MTSLGNIINKIEWLIRDNGKEKVHVVVSKRKTKFSLLWENSSVRGSVEKKLKGVQRVWRF